jgi:uncharacterized protein (DUF2252 family)
MELAGDDDVAMTPNQRRGTPKTRATTFREAARAHTSVVERKEVGRQARMDIPRSSHASWNPPTGRFDPVRLLEEQNQSRIPWLVPLRHTRMAVSPFTFYRGTARIMAADLATTPNSGLQVQLGGDAHLSNFGAYASPSRELVFDANDFDETLPGPWEWDVKRLAASFAIGGLALGFSPELSRKAAARSVRAYRKAMTRYAEMRLLDLWYDHLSVADIRLSSGIDPAEMATRMSHFERKARSHTSLQALSKLAEEVDGRYRIRSQPPVLLPLRDMPVEYNPPALEEAAYAGFEAYKESISDDRRTILDRFTPVDVGIKVVGVGSVGTRCLILLLEGRDREDPLFLQIKEAGTSVLEEFLTPSEYDNSGRRVVEGQRLVQAQSDIFLGWTQGGLQDLQFYVRQLRDWKGSVETEATGPDQMRLYAQLCGMTLARGHARSGDAVAIASYLGKGDSFDRAIAEFAESYAAQNQADYEEFIGAIGDGRLEASKPETP